MKRSHFCLLVIAAILAAIFVITITGANRFSAIGNFDERTEDTLITDFPEP